MTLASTYHGARWIRAALQVNPFGYKGKGAPSTFFDDETRYNHALLDMCEELGIELIAVTDHWCVESAVSLMADANDRNVVVLPGFEANTSEGTHLLVIFEFGTKISDINAAIGACGVNPGCNNGTTGNSYADIVTEMTKRGAFVVPAHANGGSGLLTKVSGTPLERMIKHRDLHAIGISPGLAEAPSQSAIFAGRKPFERAHSVAEIYSDDICHPDKLATLGGSTWFKLSSPGLLGIKHAVRIPATRVSLSSPNNGARILFRQISWAGGYLDGVTINLADDLTALIGGRGTGKSTVIESIRFALDMVPIGEEAKRDHMSVVSRVLGSGTTVKLVVEAISPRPGEFTIQRSVNDPVVVLDASGTRTNLRPSDIVGEIEIFGQHELAEVAQEKAHVARMIERIAGKTDDGSALEEIRHKLADNRRDIGRLEAEQTRLEEDLSEMPRLQEAIAHFDASDWSSQLSEQQRVNKDESIFSEGLERLNEVRLALIQFKASDPASRLSGGLDGITGSPRERQLSAVADSLQGAGLAVSSALDTIEQALSAAEDKLTTAKQEWRALTEPLLEKHSQIIRDLKSDGYEPDKYIASTKALNELRAKVPRAEALEKQFNALATARLQLLEELEAAERASRVRLGDAVRIANAATGGAVLAKPVPSPNRESLKMVVVKHVKGQRKRLLDEVDQELFSTRAFVAAARSGRDTLAERYDLRNAQAEAVLAAGEEFFREFEELSVAHAVDVSLDVGGENVRDYRQLDELSKGQRATALLLLLLAAAETPLVIDQPEDDLDNRFVYDQVVMRLQGLKGRRQVIVSTHNANIPVLGDAELIVTLAGDGKNGYVDEEHSGSMDARHVREAVEQILEGGRAAFGARKHLYGI